MAQKRNQALNWVYLLLVLGGSSAIVFFSFFLLDWSNYVPPHAGAKPGPIDQLLTFDPDTAQNALGNLAQVITAILGIVITVVSIIVQLAATRYTSRVAEMFFRDRTNLLVLGFFVVAGIDAVWVSLSVTHDFVPKATITATLLLVTLSVLLMVPYFAYVFDFLDPEKVVARIQEQALASTTSTEGDLETRQERVRESIEQLTDVTMNAISQKDKLIASGAVNALKELAALYLPSKSSSAAEWFTIGPGLRRNPDFVGMSPESVDDLAARRVWLEWKVLRQYQAIYNESLGEMPDMNQLVAIDTRYIGEAALAVDDGEAIRLVIKFFNTYLRATLNASQIRVAYNVLNQYRQLCEKMVGSSHDAQALEIARHLRYYGQTAHGMGLGFITETSGYDLASLCELAFERKAQSHDEILRVLLDLDRKAETDAQETMLRGVRKAQAKLATYYLAHGEERFARQIAADMKDEPASRLRSIRDELLRIATKDFWEVIDRGTNFDYLDDGRKEKLRVFFGWFDVLRAETPSGTPVTGAVQA